MFMALKSVFCLNPFVYLSVSLLLQYFFFSVQKMIPYYLLSKSFFFCPLGENSEEKLIKRALPLI